MRGGCPRRSARRCWWSAAPTSAGWSVSSRTSSDLIWLPGKWRGDMTENRSISDVSLAADACDPRKERELEFHNKRFATGTRGEELPQGADGVEKFYSVAER